MPTSEAYCGLRELSAKPPSAADGLQLWRLHLLYGCRSSGPEDSGQQCVPEHQTVSGHMRLSRPGAWVSPSPPLGLGLPITAARGWSGWSARALAAGPRAASLCAPGPGTVLALLGYPGGTQLILSKGMDVLGVHSGSQHTSNRSRIRSQATQLPALFLEIETWQAEAPILWPPDAKS